MKFGTVNRRPGSGRRSAHTDENVAVAESGRQTSEPSNSQRNFKSGEDPSVISFADHSQCYASQILQEKARLTAD